MSRTALIVATLILCACRDGVVTALKPTEVGLSANVIPCDEQPIPEPGCQDPGPPSGGGINPNDSYATANVVQTYTTTILDDATGAAHTIEAPAIALKLEAGYSSSTGADVLQYVFEDNGEIDGVRVIRLDGQTAYEIGPDGGPSPAAPGDLDGQSVNPLSAMPDLSMFPSAIDAIASGQTGFVKIASLATQMETANARVVTLPGGVAAHMLDETHLTLSAISRGSGSTEVSFELPRRGSRWVLRRIDALATVAESGKHATIRSRLDLRGMRIAHNIDADRLRDARRAKRFESFRDATWNHPSAPAPLTRQTVAADENWSQSGIVNWNPPVSLPFPVVPPTQQPAVVDPDFDKTEEEITNCENISFAASQAISAQSSGQRIIFQHGFSSGACTWKYQLPFFSGFSGGGRIVGQTNSWSTYESQAATLKSQVPSGTDQWVLVGHSNGGIISRYMAQTEQSGFAKAVITINSPHSGVRIVSGVGQLLNDVQWLTSAASAIFSRRSEGATAVAAILSGNGVPRQIWDHGGTIAQEASPGSDFLANLASRPEAHFRRFAIRSQASDDWHSVRVFCDKGLSSVPGVPKGRRCVEDQRRLVKRLFFVSGAFKILSWLSSFVPLISVLSPSLAYAAKANFVVVGIMYAVEWAWRAAFDGNTDSDGVLSMTSQRWSGAGAQSERVIYNADSHVGSTKSGLVTVQLRSLLNEAYQ